MSLVGKGVWCCLVVAFALQGLSAEEWPGWRGPARDGISTETGLMAQWPEEGPPLAWSRSGMGGGFSSLSVAGDRIFTMGDEGDSQYVLALDRGDGSILWKTRTGPAWEDDLGGPRGTPTIDGNRVYAIGTEGDLVCLETQSGEKVWSRSIPRDFGGKVSAGQNVHWKFAESPLVDGDRLIITPGVNPAALVALDKHTGNEIWRTRMPSLGERGADGAGYSSVVISMGAGVKQYVQLVGRGVIGVAADSGEFLWGYNRVANDVANIPTPIVDGDHVFVSTGYNTGSALLELSRSATGVDVREVYFLEGNRLQNHHGGLILKDGYVYTGTGHNRGFPISVNMHSGEIAWGPIRNEGKGSAAISYADGHLYFRYQNGLMVLIEATPEGYREKGSFMIPEASRFSWPHPVISDGKLYLREQDTLWCYDLRASGTDETLSAAAGE